MEQINLSEIELLEAGVSDEDLKLAESALHGIAVGVARGKFDPRRHPRSRTGEFVDVLGKLTSGPGSRGGGRHMTHADRRKLGLPQISQRQLEDAKGHAVANRGAWDDAAHEDYGMGHPGMGRDALLEKRRVARAAVMGESPPASASGLDDLHLRTVSDLASIIERDWAKVNFGAVPYLSAMHSLSSEHDDYGMDSGKSVIAYFLSNATSWRGPVAQEVKKELRRRLKSSRPSGHRDLLYEGVMRKIDRLEVALDRRLAAHAAHDAAAFREADTVAEVLASQISEALPNMKSMKKCPKCGLMAKPGSKCPKGHVMPGGSGS